MSTEAVFEYRHKKFDKNKRSRDEDSFSTESNCDSSPTLSSLLENNSSISSSPAPKRRKVNIVQQRQQSPIPVFIPAPQNVYNSMVQLMNFENQQPITYNKNPPTTTLLLPINGTIFTADNRIRIKTEPIDYSIPTQHSPAFRIDPQPIITEIKTEPLTIHKIKQELSDLNKISHMPIIPKETFEDICKYRSNMARKFPRKERSSKEHERRVKNTFACRKSRRIEKIQHVATEEEYKCYKQANLRMEEYAIRAAVYFRELMKLTTEKTTSDVVVIN